MPHTLLERTRPNVNGCRGEARPAAREPQRDNRASDPPAFTKPEVASLSPTDIRRLSSDELMAAVHAAAVPLFRADAIDRLQYCDRPTLERIVFLARRTVRNQGY
jgi:hypothetical protein